MFGYKCPTEALDTEAVPGFPHFCPIATNLFLNFKHMEEYSFFTVYLQLLEDMYLVIILHFKLCHSGFGEAIMRRVASCLHPRH